MSFSHADYLAMRARCDRSRGSMSYDHAGNKFSNQLEVGSGGIQEEIEAWLKTQSHRAWWDRKRSDKKTTSRIGVPDFVGVFAGHAFGMEIKRPGEKPTIEQLGEIAWLRKAGAKTAVVYSRYEAVEFLLGLEAKAPAGEPLATGEPPTNMRQEESTTLKEGCQGV